ncbi:MAG: ABC transporter ATP-binding protein/permease [Clostridiales bacterium]|nr:ABC transporter ATP-binding protein/permease [Clostridiales bacterium]
MKKILKVTDCTVRFILLLLLRSPFDALWTVINAVFLQNVFNAVTQNNTSGLISACLFFGIENVCLFLYNGTVWSTNATFAVRMEGRLRLKLFQKISSLPCKKVEESPSGDLLTRLNMDVQMPFSYGPHFPHAICAVANIVVSSIILLHMNLAIFIWVILFVIPYILTGWFLVAHAMPKLNKKCLEATAKNTGELTALLTCAGVSAIYDGQEYLMGRFERSSLELLRANMKMRIRNALSSAITPLFGLGGYLALLAIAGGWIGAGLLTFGDLSAVFQYRGGILAGSLMLINCAVSIQASMAGIRRINETMSEKEG